MNVQITFRGMDHSNAAEDYVKQALEKTYKFLEKEPEPIQFEVILEAHREHTHHLVEIRIHSKHNHFIVKEEGSDLYAQIDRVVKILIEEIKKQKSKYLDKRNHTPDPFREPPLEDDPEDAE